MLVIAWLTSAFVLGAALVNLLTIAVLVLVLLIRALAMRAPAAGEDGAVRAKRYYMASWVVICAFVLLLATLVTPPGFQHERVEITGEETASVGYVLSVDDISLTLAYPGGGIRRIPNTAVIDRSLCSGGFIMDGDTSPLLRLLRSTPDEYVSKNCSPAPVESGGDPRF